MPRRGCRPRQCLCGPELGLIGWVQVVKGRSRQTPWVHWGSARAWRLSGPGGPTCSITCRACDGVAGRGLLATIGRRWARLHERLDVGGGDCLSGQASVKGVGRRQQAGAVRPPTAAQPPAAEWWRGAASASAALVTASYWVWLVWSWSMRSAMPRNTWASGEMWLANAPPPRPWDGSGPDPVIGQPECVQLQEGGLSLDGGRAPGGRPSSPWPGSAPGQRKKQPAFSGCFGQAVRGWRAFGRPRLQER